MFNKFRMQVKKLCGTHAVHLEVPRNQEADIALPCFPLAKTLHKDPVKIALELAESFSKKNKSKLVKTISASGPYVNFYANWIPIGNEIIKTVLKNKENYGRGKAKEKIIVEFAHPNTHKLFHIGHLRNITVGETLSRILEFSGSNVIRANYQGDVGLHIAKCLYGIRLKGMKKFSSLDEKIRFLGGAYARGSSLYEEDENARKEIIEINKKLYEKDPNIMKLWKETRKWSLEYFDRIYKRLYTSFARLYFESEVAAPGLKIAKQALKKGVLTESEGALIFDGEKYGMDKRVFVNQLGFPTYEAKELALAELEFSEFGKIDKCVHVAGPEQASFFAGTLKVQEQLNPKKFGGRQFHLVYGWVSLKEGKMSSRLGKVIEGEWLLDELKKEVLEQYLNKQKYNEKSKSDIAEAIAIAAAKYYMLKIEPVKDILFDAAQAISFEGDTGPYLQYTYARARSILQKSRKKPSKKIIFENDEISIIKKISGFPWIIKKSAHEMKPNYLAKYLFELATLFNEFYHAKRVVGAEREEELLVLVSCVAIVLRTGMGLLGIKPLERM